MSSEKKFHLLFLSLLDYNSLEESNIYTDLLKEFLENGHAVTAISPVEKRNRANQHNYFDNNLSIYKPLIGNIQKTNLLQKGLSTITLEKKLIKQIKKINTKFDLVLYSTPPVTFERSIRFVKKRDNATSYLLLKDIFPQNAIDLGLIPKNIFGKIIYSYFRKKEKRLYSVSDYIGCMSQANKEYILSHNTLDENHVEVNPNSERDSNLFTNLNKEKIFNYYKINTNKKIFIYGGNFGKPQGIEYIKKCIIDNERKFDSFFVFVGSGTEFNSLYNFINENNILNSILINKLPKEEFEKLVQLSDVGLIFLDNRFTIPNYPSRLLTYLKFRKPVLMAVDRSTDIGIIAKENGYGDYVYSDSVTDFSTMVDKYTNNMHIIQMGLKGYEFFKKNYVSNITYKKIIEKMRY